MQLDIVVERQTVSYLEVIEVEDQLVQIFCEQVRAAQWLATRRVSQCRRSRNRRLMSLGITGLNTASLRAKPSSTCT